MMDWSFGMFGIGMMAWGIIWVALLGFVFGLAFWYAKKVVFGEKKKGK